MRSRRRLPARPRSRRLAAVAALAAALLAPAAARAASCCGGGGGGQNALARGDRALADLSLELERYDGYWDPEARHKPDPPGSSLAQLRTALALGTRLAGSWQLAVGLPFVWNRNSYSGLSSRTQGLGDTTLNLWWEALDERTAWRLRELADLVPSVTIGPSLVLPTGISPYDRVASSFDVTGRGFYRLDGNLLVDKGYRALSVSLAASYGIHLSRPVNRVYGKWVEPYRKRLGDRASLSGSVGYRVFLNTAGDSLSGALALAWVHEGQGTIDGSSDPTSGMGRTGLGATLTWSSTDSDWMVRASWSHAIQRDGWGRNFPTTDTFSLGVRFALR